MFGQIVFNQIMFIAEYYVEQERKDTPRVVHYAGGNVKRAIQTAKKLSFTANNAAWIIRGNKPISKYFKGKRFSPVETV